MSVFRRKRTNRKGWVTPGNTYTIEFRDQTDVVRRVSGFTDRSVSVELERQLKRLVALRMAGTAPDADLFRFLESCPGEIRENLGKWGVIAGERAAAESGGTVQGMTGYIRSLLYRLAIEIGLRSSEIRSLTRASFDFSGETATVTVSAKHAKNRKEATLPLRPELAQDMREYLTLHMPATRVFPSMGKQRSAAMLRVDL